MTDNQDRERVAEYIHRIEHKNTPYDGIHRQYALQIASWHLKEVEKAYARGMKKAAEEMLHYAQIAIIDIAPESGDEVEIEAVSTYFVRNIITAANKTLEAEGDTDAH